MKSGHVFRRALGFLVTSLTASALLLSPATGCGVKAGNPNSTEGGTRPGGGGQVNVSITDAPIDGASHFLVRVKAVEIFARSPAILEDDGSAAQATYTAALSGAIRREFEQPVEFDLLAYRNGKFRSLVSNWDVPSGRYEEVRLVLDRISPLRIVGAGGRKEAVGLQLTRWHSASQAPWIGVIGPFSVEEGGKTNLGIHVDLRTALVPAESVTADRRPKSEGGAPALLLSRLHRFYKTADLGIVRGTGLGEDVRYVCLRAEGAEGLKAGDDCTSPGDKSAVTEKGSFLVYHVTPGLHSVWGVTTGGEVRLLVKSVDVRGGEQATVRP